MEEDKKVDSACECGECDVCKGEETPAEESAE
jgi:hypothetical protein